MSDEPFDRLHSARVDAGFSTAREACQRFGWTYSTYSSHERGLRGFKLDQARRYAKAFKVSTAWLMTGSGERQREGDEVVSIPVVGVMAAGMWLDADDHFADEVVVPAVPDPRYPVTAQIAFQVRGPSMNLLIDDGAFAIGVRIEQAPPIRNNDVVAVKRTRGGLVETTVKRYRVVDGVPALYPESTDPRHQEPIKLQSEDEFGSVEVIALVIGSYRAFR